MEKLHPDFHFLSAKKIIVVGAGVSGLAFTITLRKLWPSELPPPTITVFERDSLESLDTIARRGYSLALRSDAPVHGIQHIQKIGLLEEMMKASIQEARKDGAGFCIWNDNMREVLKVSVDRNKSLPASSLRIMRSKMRQVLIDAVGDAIRWNTAIQSVSPRDDHVQITLSDGTTETCDYLIACDGANSKIRNILRPEDKLIYRGYKIVMGTATYGNGTPQEPVDRCWGLLPDGKGKAAFLSPMDSHSALWSISASATDDAVETDPDAIIAIAKSYESSFCPLVSKMIADTDKSTVRMLHLRDKAPFKHEPGNRVIFIGDANHAVSPYAGNGANMAFADAWDLALSLVNAKSADEALEQYDAVSFKRSSAVIKQSHFTINVAHSTGWKFWVYMRFFRLVNVIIKVVKYAKSMT